jgi:hypothetical protein
MAQRADVFIAARKNNQPTRSTRYSSIRAPNCPSSSAESSRPRASGGTVSDRLKKRPPRAHLRGEVHGQNADHRVAGLDDGHVQMVELPIDLEPLARGPFDGAGMTGDEVGGHGSIPCSKIMEDGLDCPKLVICERPSS